MSKSSKKGKLDDMSLADLMALAKARRLVYCRVTVYADRYRLRFAVFNLGGERTGHYPKNAQSSMDVMRILRALRLGQQQTDCKEPVRPVVPDWQQV